MTLINSKFGSIVLLAALQIGCGRARVLGNDLSPGDPGDGDLSTSGDGDVGNSGDGDTSTTDTTSTGDGDGDTGSSLDFPLDSKPDFNGFVRLTHSQWDNSVRDIFELDRAPGISSKFIPDYLAGHFTNNERSLFVEDDQWTSFQLGAEELAKLVTSDAALLDHLGGVTDPAKFIKKVGRRAFRRALSAQESADYETIWSYGAESAVDFSTGDSATDGARLFIEALLQSPHFLYRIESAEDGQRLSGLELATKLSLLLLDTTPSDDLLAAAEAGDLDTDEGLLKVASRMLSEQGGLEALRRFHSELYRVGAYPEMKSAEMFPDYTKEVGVSMMEADLRFFDYVYSQEGGIRELLLSPTAFVDALTAAYYDLPVPKSGFEQVEVEGRPGHLSHLGFLAQNADSTRPNPIRRGSLILSRFMCLELSEGVGAEVPPPPEPLPEWTNREYFTSLTEDAACRGCHQNYIDPLGFAFENYDAMGQSQDIDNGHPVDTSATFTFSDGPQTFANSQELVSLLTEEPATHRCYSARMAEYILARDLDESDEQAVKHAAELSLEKDVSMQELVLKLVSDPIFTLAKSGD